MSDVRCIWLTGLPGSGKTTLAELLVEELSQADIPAYHLDGDVVRRGLCSDLGFSDDDRAENIRRVSELAKMLSADLGVLVVVSLVSPYRADRWFARSRFGEGEFVEVFVDAPVAVCERRDPKGMYAKARRGEIRGFTGVDALYEEPKDAELRLPTAEKSPEECVGMVMELMRRNPDE
jgi:adenylyl-sulfate kinase